MCVEIYLGHILASSASMKTSQGDPFFVEITHHELAGVRVSTSYVVVVFRSLSQSLESLRNFNFSFKVFLSFVFVCVFEDAQREAGALVF